MADMNELLEKYFKGETSLQEENLLKMYFRSGQVKAGHEIYRSMFDAFEEESQVVMPAPKRKVIDLKQPKLKRIGWQSISISGIAATVLLAFWFFRTEPVDADYAVIHGKRINNAAYAQQMAIAKMEKVNGILVKTMKPMQNIQKIKNSLEPINKISDVRIDLENIQDKLNFK